VSEPTTFIKLDRNILSWRWYGDMNTFKLFIHLLLKANFEDREWQNKIILRGELVTSISRLSEETGLTVKQVRTALNHLKGTNEVASRSTAQYTVITILNYEKYQGGASQTANEGQTEGKQRANEGQQLKKYKKYNNNNKYKEESNKEESTDAERPATRPDVPYEKIIELYNDKCPMLPSCRTISEARKKAIRARMASGHTVEDFALLFDKTAQSSFLKGANNRNWRATFDWLVKDSNMAKVLDGNYDDHKGVSPQRKNDLDFIPD
jgi:uncharacterized phage protein (TIGR02220 family)